MHTHIAALHAAAQRLGSADTLARHLRLPPGELDRWLLGVQPDEIHFLRAVEVLIADPDQLRQFMQAAADEKLVFDKQARRAYVDGRELALPLTEWAVLESLSARMGQVVSRHQLGREFALWTGRSVDALQMYVFRLRLKLAPAKMAIRTVHRAGYVLEAEAA
jgi:DNA-binding response OmpR family regulator